MNIIERLRDKVTKKTPECWEEEAYVEVSKKGFVQISQEDLSALLEVVEAVDKMLPEVDDFLFCFDEEQAIWTSYMSRLGDLLDKLEAPDA